VSSEAVGIIEAGARSHYYSDNGKGFPLLFIHGWLMSRRAWALQAPLAAEHRVITLDLCGHGSAYGAEFSYRTCCEDVALLCEYLNLDRVVMVGWSMGAQIAIKAYPALREKVAGMVLVGGTPRFCSSKDFTEGVAPAEARSMSLRIKKDYNRTAGEFFRSMFTPAEAASVDMQLLASSVVSRLPARDTALSSLDELIHTDLRADLPLVSTPVMLIHGLEDKICLPGAAKYMAENFPSATMNLIPAAGHAPFLSDPRTFNDMISGFAQVVHG
jgi:pimeloyl-[acyl-carrier protein] methyl ester esterase